MRFIPWDTNGYPWNRYSLLNRSPSKSNQKSESVKSTAWTITIDAKPTVVHRVCAGTIAQINTVIACESNATTMFVE